MQRVCRTAFAASKRKSFCKPSAAVSPAYARGGKKVMAEVKVKEGESLDSALRRFKRQCARSNILTDLRKREYYEKPSVKRKKKSEAARKRKYK